MAGRAVAARQPPESPNESGFTGKPAPARPAADRVTGRLVRLPDEPVRLGELDAAAILRPLVSGPVIVDNDVNWAARAERDAAGRGQDGDFAYLFLGEGLGAAVVSNGDVVRGHAGLDDEVAHIIVPGPSAARFIDVFGLLGLRQPETTAIDVPRLLAVATGPGSGAAVREPRDCPARSPSGPPR